MTPRPRSQLVLDRDEWDILVKQIEGVDTVALAAAWGGFRWKYSQDFQRACSPPSGTISGLWLSAGRWASRRRAGAAGTEAETNAGLLCSARNVPPKLCRCSRTPRARSPRISARAITWPSANWIPATRPKAEENFRAALEINPKSAGAELGLAHALVRQEKLGDAAPHFRQAAQIDASYRDGLLELAGLYEKNNQIPEALAILREFPENAARAGAFGRVDAPQQAIRRCDSQPGKGLRHGSNARQPRRAGAGLPGKRRYR